MAEVEHMGLTVGTSQLADEDSIKLKMLISELDEAVEQRLPGYKTMLAQIHSILKADPVIVTFLEPEEAALIIKALSTARGEVFEEKAAKATKAKVSKTKNLGALL